MSCEHKEVRVYHVEPLDDNDEFYLDCLCLNCDHHVYIPKTQEEMSKFATGDSTIKTKFATGDSTIKTICERCRTTEPEIRLECTVNCSEKDVEK